MGFSINRGLLRQFRVQSRKNYKKETQMYSPDLRFSPVFTHGKYLPPFQALPPTPNPRPFSGVSQKPISILYRLKYGFKCHTQDNCTVLTSAQGWQQKALAYLYIARPPPPLNLTMVLGFKAKSKGCWEDYHIIMASGLQWAVGRT